MRNRKNTKDEIVLIVPGKGIMVGKKIFPGKIVWRMILDV